MRLRVTAIEILAESAADISVNAYSSVISPQLIVVGGNSSGGICGQVASNLPSQLESLDADLQTWTTRYHQAPSNSLMEAHCRNMKNIISQ